MYKSFNDENCETKLQNCPELGVGKFKTQIFVNNNF